MVCIRFLQIGCLVFFFFFVLILFRFFVFLRLDLVVVKDSLVGVLFDIKVFIFCAIGLLLLLVAGILIGLVIHFIFEVFASLTHVFLLRIFVFRNMILRLGVFRKGLLVFLIGENRVVV